MTKQELSKKLYGAIVGSYDPSVFRMAVMADLQITLSQVVELTNEQKQDIMSRVVDVIDMDEFTQLWSNVIAPVMTKEELQKLVDYFESPLYEEIQTLMDKIEPAMQQALVAYAELTTDKLLDGIDTNKPAVMN